MKYTGQFLFFLILICSSAHSQNTNVELHLEYEKASTPKEKLTAAVAMEKNGFINKYITISKAYYEINQNKLAYKYLQKAIETGETLDREYAVAFIPSRDLERIKVEYPKLRSIFYQTFDEELYNLVNYLYSADQYLARENFYGGRKTQHPIRKKVFQNNLTLLRNHIIQNNTNQLPQRSEIGNLTREVVLIMMHHTRLDSIDEVNYNFFEPLLKEEVLIRKSYSPYTYIQFVDNMQLVVEEGKLQVYGHFRNYKTNKIFELKFPEKVDELRAEIGLQSLKEYAKKNDFILPDNYVDDEP